MSVDVIAFESKFLFLCMVKSKYLSDCYFGNTMVTLDFPSLNYHATENSCYKVAMWSATY